MFEDYIASGLQGLKDIYPDVHKKLELAGARLQDGSRPEDFQAIGVICRDALIIFANAIFSPDFVPEDQQMPKEGDTKGRIELTLQHFGQMSGTEELRNLTKAVWSYALRLQHNQRATREEAHRTALFTTLALAELAVVMAAATEKLELFQRYGFWKCPVCGSTDLVEDDLIDYEKDGPRLVAQDLACRHCPWSILTWEQV